jgi:hydrogenase expression/formation protein HypC
MCLAIPAKIIRIDGATAQVDVTGNTVEADVSLLEGLSPGDYVIVHAGIAIQKYDREEALRTLELFRELAEAGGGL